MYNKEPIFDSTIEKKVSRLSLGIGYSRKDLSFKKELQKLTEDFGRGAFDRRLLGKKYDDLVRKYKTYELMPMVRAI